MFPGFSLKTKENFNKLKVTFTRVTISMMLIKIEKIYLFYLMERSNFIRLIFRIIVLYG